MTIGHKIAILATLTASMLLQAACPVHSHEWYDGKCCNEVDCRQTVKGEVERRADGWYVVPTKELIPFDDERIKRSMDVLIHRCVFAASVSNFMGAGITKNAGDTRCLYVPEIAG